MTNGEITIRRADRADLPAAIAVAARALGWQPDDPNEDFFRWKHLDNPAGPSPMWVAVDGDTICGFRAMLRWNFNGSDHVLHALRAVDTATDPDHQRLGIFKKLTLAAITELTSAGADFVFNTPNDKSRPGYLKMGWTEAGRLPVRFSPTGPVAITRLARARTAANKWSEPIAAGEPVESCPTDLAGLVESLPAADGISTVRDADHFTWRYGFGPLHYRVIRTNDAAAIVRVRRRGAAREAVLAEVLSPDSKATAMLIRKVRRALRVDYLITLDCAPHPSRWWPTLPGVGPHLTLRSLATSPPSSEQFRFSLGDIELF